MFTDTMLFPHKYSHNIQGALYWIVNGSKLRFSGLILNIKTNESFLKFV